MKGFGKPPRKKKPLEASVEKRSCGFAKAEGVLSRKMNGSGFRAWPDRAFMPPDMGTPWEPCVPVIWVEFKRVGEDLTPAQAELQADLVRRGQRVCTVRTLDEFKQHFFAWMSDDLGLEDYRL